MKIELPLQEIIKLLILNVNLKFVFGMKIEPKVCDYRKIMYT
jgi:hypothetical protein